MNPELQKIDEQINAIINDIAGTEAGLIVLKENLKTLRKKRKQLVKLYDKIDKVANGNAEQKDNALSD